MSIYSFNDYKEFVRNRAEETRGQYRKLAEALRVQSSLVSQIFSGFRHLTAEQACSVARFFKLDPNETRYFVSLVQLERAGTVALKEMFREDLKRLRRPQSLVEVVPSKDIMSEEEQALFYSHWFYSGVRLATSIDGLSRAEPIAQHLGIPSELASKILAFLLSTKLCVEENGRMKMGPKATRVDPNSPLASRFHINWRLKAIEQVPNNKNENFFQTRVVSISKADAAAVQRLLFQLLGEIDSKIDRSKPEILACLNLDWFEF